MKKLVIVVITMLLSACASSPLPNTNIATIDACPAPFNAFACAPASGESLVYAKFPPIIPIVNGSPRYQDYLGTILRDDDKDGANPRYCGNQAVPAFRIDDLDVNPVPHSIRYEHTLSGTSAASASVDLVQALKRIGVSDAKLNDISMSTKGIWNRLNNRKATTDANFVIAKISVPTFNRFLSGSAPAYQESCYAQIYSDVHVRLISAMSGYWVKSASEDTTIKNELVAELKVALSGVVTDSQILNLTPELSRVASTALSKASGEHFVVRSVVFYNPKKYGLKD